jgi:hypothetical protein
VIDPKRFVVNWDVYVGRPSVYGNPFSHEENTLAQFHVLTRAEAIARFEDHLLSSPSLLVLLPGLRGKRLACWCAPLPCHAEILAFHANKY